VRNVVYTYLTGDYDTLKAPEVVTPGWDYLCFTDNTHLKSEVWELRPVPGWCEVSADLKRKASLIKIAHYSVIDSAYAIAISMDASMAITGDLDEFVADIGFDGYDFMALKHLERNCVYKEARVVMERGLDYVNVINAHMQRYREAGYPQNNGLWAGEFSVRRNGSSSLRKACQVWFREYTSGSRRDQLSLNYSFWKSAALGSPVKVKCMDRGSVLRKFRYGAHRSGTFHQRNIAYRSAKLHTDKSITVL
jgi:hypothetical protein